MAVPARMPVCLPASRCDARRVPRAVRLPAGAICTTRESRLATCTACTRRRRARPPNSWRRGMARSLRHQCDIHFEEAPMNPNPPGVGQPRMARVVAAIPLMSRIDLQEQSSLRYWCRMLGATPLEICRAVESVGSDPAAVRAHFKRRRDPIRLRTRRVRRAGLTVSATRSIKQPVAAAILGMHGRARSFPPHGFVP